MPDYHWQYKVTWYRADWSSNTKPKSKTFDSQRRVEGFVNTLVRGELAGEWSELVYVEIAKRRVSPWEVVPVEGLPDTRPRNDFSWNE